MSIIELPDEQIIERNKQCKANGDFAEQMAEQYFNRSMSVQSVEHINTEFDFLVDDSYIEVKSCQMLIQNYSRNEMRHGLFCLKWEQHSALYDLDGYYLFIVLSQQSVGRVKLVRAREIEYQKQITWTKIFGGE